MSDTKCPTCGLTGGFHDRDAHARGTSVPESLKWRKGERPAWKMTKAEQDERARQRRGLK
jgi:hypothetical protein